jgi:hypothetical protein
MGFIKLQLEFWLNSRVGRAISEPSTFRTDAPLLVFALRNLTEDDDAAILALSAYSAALRRALSSPESIFFIDESPILFEFDQISELVARLCANGAKAGVRVILSAQDVDTIAKSPSASKILQNLSTRLVGRIQPNAVASFVKYLNYDESIIARNATASFFPSVRAFTHSGCWTTILPLPFAATTPRTSNSALWQTTRMNNGHGTRLLLLTLTALQP